MQPLELTAGPVLPRNQALVRIREAIVSGDLAPGVLLARCGNAVATAGATTTEIRTAPLSGLEDA